MRESYIEGLANHDDPESCVPNCKVRGEALTGACAGTVLSREIKQFRVLTLLTERKATRWASFSQDVHRPCAVVDPLHVQNLSAREQGGPIFPRRMARRGASARPEAVTR